LSKCLSGFAILSALQIFSQPAQPDKMKNKKPLELKRLIIKNSAFIPAWFFLRKNF